MKIIITENQLSLLVHEGVNGPLNENILTDFITKFSNFTFDEFMEGVREFMGGTAGVIIQTLIDMIPGAGKFINMGAWSLLGLYDVIKGTTKGAWNWFNILVDFAGILLSGPGATWVKKALGPIANMATGKLSTFFQAMAKKVPQAYSYVTKLVSSFGSIISKVSSAFSKFISWAAKYFKGTSIYKSLLNMKSSMTSGLNKVIGWFKNLIGEKGVKAVKNAVQKTTHTGKHVAQHQAQHSAVHAGAAALTGGGGHH
jgi:hypothetical protein